jgi:ABC-type xylose transport system permease subunit
VFFAVLGPRPGAAQYARAAETVLWIGLGLISVMAALTALLPATRLAATSPSAGPHAQRAAAKTAST